MPRKSKEQRWSEVHADAMAAFQRIQTATWPLRQMSLEDRAFAVESGAQWRGVLNSDNGEAGQRLRLEINRIRGAVIRLQGEHRNNRVTVDFLPKDGSPKSTNAEALNGLFRADWQDCDGDEAGDNAFGEAIMGGVGAVHVTECYEDDLDGERDDEEGEDGEGRQQRITIEPIVDADISVFWDLDSKKQNKSDAHHVFKVLSMTHQRFKDLYPKEDMASFPKGTYDLPCCGSTWVTADMLYVAEYFVRDRVSEEWVELVSDALDKEPMHVLAEDLDPEEGPEQAAERRHLEAIGWREVRRYEKKRRRVMKYVMTGAGILSEQEIAGRCLPVVPLYGIRDYVDGKEIAQGIVRIAKDVQRLTNFLASFLAEIAAISAPQVPVLYAEEVLGYQNDWANHATEPRTFLVRNAMKDAEGRPIATPLQTLPPPQLPPAIAAAVTLFGADLKELLGSQEQREKVVSNISGKAVEMIQQYADAQTLIFLDNYKKFMRALGVVWKSKARALYLEPGRRMKTIAADGRSRSTVTLGEPTFTEQGEYKPDGLVDLTAEDFDVVVDVGPSTTTRREKVARDFIALATLVPESDPLRQIITLSAAANIEGTDSAFQDWASLELIRRGVGTPSDDQARILQQEAQAKQPDGQSAALQAQAKALTANANKEQALAQKAMVDAQLAAAKIALTEAQTLSERVDAGLSLANAMRPQQPVAPAPGAPA